LSKKRNVSFIIQKHLLDQIGNRAEIRNVSRNEEMRSLIKFAIHTDHLLTQQISIPEGEMVRTVVWLDLDDGEIVRERAASYQRSTSQEIVRIFALALEEVTNRDLAIISSLLARQSLQDPSKSGTEAS